MDFKVQTRVIKLTQQTLYLMNHLHGPKTRVSDATSSSGSQCLIPRGSPSYSLPIMWENNLVFKTVPDRFLLCATRNMLTGMDWELTAKPRIKVYNLFKRLKEKSHSLKTFPLIWKPRNYEEEWLPTIGHGKWKELLMGTSSPLLGWQCLRVRLWWSVTTPDTHKPMKRVHFMLCKLDAKLFAKLLGMEVLRQESSRVAGPFSPCPYEGDLHPLKFFLQFFSHSKCLTRARKLPLISWPHYSHIPSTLVGFLVLR